MDREKKPMDEIVDSYKLHTELFLLQYLKKLSFLLLYNRMNS